MTATLAFPLTPEEHHRIVVAATQVWNGIAHDVLEASEGRPLPRAEVIEVVIDADRLRSHLLRDKTAMAHPGIAALVTTLGDWKHKDWMLADRRLQDVVAAAFPLRYYA